MAHDCLMCGAPVTEADWRCEGGQLCGRCSGLQDRTATEVARLRGQRLALVVALREARPLMSDAEIAFTFGARGTKGETQLLAAFAAVDSENGEVEPDRVIRWCEKHQREVTNRFVAAICPNEPGCRVVEREHREVDDRGA